MEKDDWRHLEDSMHYWSPEAKGEAVEEQRDRGVIRRMGERVMGMFQRGWEGKGKDGVVKDFGESMMVKQRTGAKMEDTRLRMDKEEVFGVFDGAGGERGASRASYLAAEAVQEYLQRPDVDLTKLDKMVGTMKEALEHANEVVADDGEAGYSTAVLGKIFRKEDGTIRIAWSSVGDSRIYVVRGSKTFRLTEDEAIGHKITNALGDRASKVRQGKKIELLKGDRVVMVSDGVTGDEGGASWEEGGQIMPDGLLGRIVGGARSAEDAAYGLVTAARKNDDRTALVIEV